MVSDYERIYGIAESVCATCGAACGSKAAVLRHHQLEHAWTCQDTAWVVFSWAATAFAGWMFFFGLKQ